MVIELRSKIIFTGEIGAGVPTKENFKVQIENELGQIESSYSCMAADKKDVQSEVKTSIPFTLSDDDRNLLNVIIANFENVKYNLNNNMTMVDKNNSFDIVINGNNYSIPYRENFELIDKLEEILKISMVKEINKNISNEIARNYYSNFEKNQDTEKHM